MVAPGRQWEPRRSFICRTANYALSLAFRVADALLDNVTHAGREWRAARGHEARKIEDACLEIQALRLNLARFTSTSVLAEALP